MLKPRPSAVLLALCLLALAAPAVAHRLQVFAFADGDSIEGSVYFAGGAAAVGVPLRIEDAAGRTLAELQTAADGSFRWHAASASDLLIIAETGDGHRAEWRIGAAELAPGFAAAEAPSVPSPKPVAAGDAAVAQDTAPPPSAAVGPDAAAALSAQIERAVARQLGPLRAELAAAQARAGLRDVLGGLGYIAGLAGLGLWLRCRRARTLDRGR